MKLTGWFSILVLMCLLVQTRAGDFNSDLMILMEWNGRRGYYKKMSPQNALKRAQKICTKIKQNYSPDLYQDYQRVIHKIENTKLAELRLYCPVKSALLFIDRQPITKFEDWDKQKHMYYISTMLPIDPGYAYQIHVQLNEMESTQYHTHLSAGSCYIQRLYANVVVQIQTSFFSRVVIAGQKKKVPWSKKHHCQLRKDKIYLLKISVKNGPTLQLELNTTEGMKIKIEQQYSAFCLIYHHHRFPFIAHEVSILDF